MREKRTLHLHGARIKSHTLMIPARDIEGKLWSLQLIYPYGKGHKKIMLPGSTYAGCFFQFGEIKEWHDAIFFAEGWATANTIYELQGRPTICCFGSGNIKNVAKEFRKLYPHTTFVIAADFDEVGQDKGLSAAKAVGGICLKPPIDFKHPSVTDWNDYLEYEGESKAMSKLLEFQEQEKELTKQEWIDEWLKNNRVEVKYSNRITVFGKEQSSVDDLFDQLYCAQEQQYRKISQALIKSRLNLYIKERWREEFERLKAPLFKENLITKEINDPAMDYVYALTQDKNPMHYAAVEHFIWQVKRKIKGYPIENHMMLIFHGAKQGKGKSVALKKLIEPVGDLAKPGDLALCSDKRDWDALERYFIIYMDEMAKIDKADVNTIKKIITEDELNYRSPHGKGTKCVKNASTLIGTTNDDPQDILADTTGNRRFYVIFTKDIDWDLINSCHYLGMWQNVDEKAPSPIVPFLEDIRSYQATYKRKGAVEQWLDDCDAKNTEGYAYSLNDDLWDNFKSWLETAHTSKLHFSRDKMGRELTRLGFKRMRKAGGNRDRGYEIQVEGVSCEAYHDEK